MCTVARTSRNGKQRCRGTCNRPMASHKMLLRHRLRCEGGELVVRIARTTAGSRSVPIQGVAPFTRPGLNGCSKTIPLLEGRGRSMQVIARADGSRGGAC